jgi:alkanesulfonate monooxygenase
MSSKQMKLGALLHTAGQHVAAWRSEDGVPESSIDIEAAKNLARLAERGKMDFVFVADILGLKDWSDEVVARVAHNTFLIEPLTMMAALSAVTEKVGFVVTASTTYVPPYLLARQIASLDLISGGRAGWNIVTSAADTSAHNLGLKEPLPHDQRYEQGTEAVEAVLGFWSSAAEGLFVGDKETGVLWDQSKFAPYVHDGKHFSLRGILNAPPSAQNRPVLVQAGASPPGRQLAAQFAEVIFASTPTIETAFEYRNDIHRRMREAGRETDSVAIMPGFVPIVGSSEDDAREKWAKLDALVEPEVSLTILSELIGGVDLSGYDIDGPFPELENVSNRSQTMFNHIAGIAAADNLSIRETGARVAAGLTHIFVPGTPEQIADFMEDWFSRGACDGFLVSPLVTPSHLQEFVDLVIPILQERGLYRTEYESSTLRGNLGLSARQPAVCEKPALEVAQS